MKNCPFVQQITQSANSQIATVPQSVADVRFAPNSATKADIPGRLKSAISGHLVPTSDPRLQDLAAAAHAIKARGFH
jgi:hypothetical protein